MKLYLIEQDENGGYDTFDSAVVCAESEEAARNTLPASWASFGDSAWCSSPDKVKVFLIGEAASHIEAGPVRASFNAG